MRAWTCIVALALVGAPLHAQRAKDRHQLPDLTVHDFAAKYMMQQGDLADLRVYREDNAAIEASADHRPRIVLLGDSITYHWQAKDRPAPAGLNVIDRGIVGQNTDQMLLRFEEDVVALDPAAVVIAGGANDMRVYVGPPAAARDAVVARIARNVTAMADIADGRGIKVIIAAITPCRDCAALGRDPATIMVANAWLRGFAEQRHYPFADYYAALTGPDGQLPADMTKDGLHPTSTGYARMWARLAPALKALRLAEH